MQSFAEVAAFTRHRGPVTSTAMRPGTRQVVTGAYDGAVGLFDLDSGAVRLIGYHRHLVNRVVVDADGRRVASCSSDYAIHLWDLDAPGPPRVLLGHADDVEDFVFIDGGRGASASRDGRILVWDLATGAIRHVFDDHEKDVLSLASEGGRLYSSGDDKTLRVWDVDAGRLLYTVGPFALETDTCAIDVGRGRIILGCDDGAIRVFDSETGAPVGEVAAHASGIKKVAVSRRGDLLSAAYDQKIIVWDGGTLERRLELEGAPHKWERSFTFSPDGASVLAGTFDGTVIEWDAASGRKLREVGGGEGNACFNRVAASPAGDVAVVADDGRVRMARVTSAGARWLARVEPPTGRRLMNAVAIDGDTVAAGSHDQRLHLYRFDGEALVDHREARLGEGPINFISIARHPGAEGDCFVGCYSGTVVRVSPDGEIRARLPVHEGAVKSVRLHPERPLGVSCSADGKLRSWTFDGAIVERFLGHTAIVNDADVEPSGHLLASVGRDFTLKVYELDTGRLLQSIALGRRSLKSVCFVSADVALVGDYWGGLIRVDLASGDVVRRVVARNGISSLARCGDLVVATSYDGGLYAVRPADLSLAHRIEAMTQRCDVTP